MNLGEVVRVWLVEPVEDPVPAAAPPEDADEHEREPSEPVVAGA